MLVKLSPLFLCGMTEFPPSLVCSACYRIGVFLCVCVLSPHSHLPTAQGPISLGSNLAG